jgi:prophage tail gpP-like protein
VLLLSDGLGNLVMTRASTSRITTVLELGTNIFRANGTASHRDRFSQYQVKGQQSGSDDWYGEDAAHPLGSATDGDITRHRPLTVLAEEQIDSASAKERAEWERNVRYGRSRRISYTVHGWYHADGLWQPNVLVDVRDPFLSLTGTRLVAGVGLTLDEDGFTTTLELLPRQAFDRIELPEPGEDATW